jgi:hypothetical protein
MLDHFMQRDIINKLSFADSLRFSELQPDDIDNKLFSYHLKKVLSSGLVEKLDDGKYRLTKAGRRVSTGVKDHAQQLVTERPYSVLFLVIRKKADGAWLIYKRPIHPMRGYQGFMHCHPSQLVESTVAARHECKNVTGLDGKFKALGGGYFRIFDQDGLESFTHFSLLYCDDIIGELTNIKDYTWVDKPDFKDRSYFPSTSVLHKAYLDKKTFYLEETYQI